ncbi:MAG TPA: metallophosphoesterase [Vicinamibacterales bacterium]|nr:metallophosphoesterase [Vicinamibacterales bacterium]
MQRLKSFVCAAFVAITLSWSSSAGYARQATAVRSAQPATATSAEQTTQLPNRAGSLKFAVLGDFGTGEQRQYQLAEQMVKLHERFAFDMVILVGDNLYGSERPQDFRKKFETPYKPLLDANVKFYASLGNHDAREQRSYKLFNMEGKLYYDFKAPAQNVRFFALESTYPEPDQIKWISDELKKSSDDWKIVFFHHPLYSTANRHGSDVRLRETLEPIFVQNGVSVVFTGHDHVYERITPQKNITYFVTGSGGKLATGDLDTKSPIMARGYDRDNVFLAAEISGDEMWFNAISRTGETIDSGTLKRREMK